MATIQAFHIAPNITTWSQARTVSLQPRVAVDGKLEYRFAMYPLLNCEVIETLQYKTAPGRIQRNCAFLVCDECFARNQREDNLLLREMGISIKGPVLLVGGTRLQKNKHLFNFSSLPAADYLAKDKLETVLKHILCGWIMRNAPQPVPVDVARSGQVFTPQEYAWEWHEQHKAIQRELLSQLISPDDLRMNKLPILSDTVCAGCRQIDVRLKRCGACRVTGYCSTACQRLDRQHHLEFCNEIVANRGSKVA